MGKLILGRLIAAIPLLFLVSILAFALVHLMPGSPSETILGDGATEEAVAQLDAQLGLDRPLPVQYLDWAGSALKGDFGASVVDNKPVSSTISSRMPTTLSLTAAGMSIALLIGIPSGAFAALHRGSAIDRLLSMLTSTGLAIPNFWLASLLAYWVGVRLGWFPAIGYTGLSESPAGWLRSLVLPGIAVGLSSAAVIARQMRSSLIDVMERPFIRTAVSKGLSRGRIVVQHAMKNAFIPVVTTIGFQVSLMLGGAFVIESVFAMPGLGSRTVEAVLERDIPVIQAVVMVTATSVLLVNLLVDISYAYFDPRVRA